MRSIRLSIALIINGEIEFELKSDFGIIFIEGNEEFFTARLFNCSSLYLSFFNLALNQLSNDGVAVPIKIGMF